MASGTVNDSQQPGNQAPTQGHREQVQGQYHCLSLRAARCWPQRGPPERRPPSRKPAVRQAASPAPLHETTTGMRRAKEILTKRTSQRPGHSYSQRPTETTRAPACGQCCSMRLSVLPKSLMGGDLINDSSTIPHCVCAPSTGALRSGLEVLCIGAVGRGGSGCPEANAPKGSSPARVITTLTTRRPTNGILQRSP